MLRNAFLACLGILFTTGCGGKSQRPLSTFPFEFGEQACSTTVRSKAGTTTTRTVREGSNLRLLIDLDGDQNPDEQQVSAFDEQGRVVTVDYSPDGETVMMRQRRIYDGQRLLRVEVDHLTDDGADGVDGTADSSRSFIWEGERLVREELDELGEDNLLGLDGEPEFVTTWLWEGGVRKTGTRIDTRDQAVLLVETLDWKDGRLLTRKLDWGGDGEVDVAMTYTWDRRQVTDVRIESALDPSEIEYGYCR